MKQGYLRIETELANAEQPGPKLRVDRTTSLWERMRGLLLRPSLVPGRGLLIVPCNSVHTFFMGYAIDLIYLDRHGRVVKVAEAVPPFRMSMAVGAAAVLELAAGEAEKNGIDVGTVWTWEEA